MRPQGPSTADSGYESWLPLRKGEGEYGMVVVAGSGAMFSLFPFFQAAEAAVTLKFQIRVSASNQHISARACGHMLCHLSM